MKAGIIKNDSMPAIDEFLRLYSQSGSGRDGTAAVSHRESRCISGRHQAAPGKYPDFKMLNSFQRYSKIVLSSGKRGSLIILLTLGLLYTWDCREICSLVLDI